MKYIIELSKTSWVADWKGDPGRTLKLQNAKLFSTYDSAKRALTKIRKECWNRDFSKSSIRDVEIKFVGEPK